MTTPFLARTVLLAALGFAAVAHAGAAHAGQAADDADTLAEGGLPARIEAAGALRKRDVRRLGAALSELGRRRADRAGTVAFLCAFTVDEPGRVLRVLSVEAASRLDGEAGAAAFAKVVASGEDPLRAERAAEAVGWLGVGGHSGALLEAVAVAPERTAIAALEALARTATAKDAERVAASALRRSDDAVLPHAAWVVLDLAGSKKSAVRAFRDAASEAAEWQKPRAEAAVEVLADRDARPHRWKTDLTRARKSLLKAPRQPEVSSGNPENVTWMQKGLRWLGRQSAADLWLVCAVVDRVESGAQPTSFDVKRRTITCDWGDAGLAQPRFAVLIARIAGAMWRAQFGGPAEGRRGWEQALADGFVLCKAARLYGADADDADRADHVTRLLGHRPWELR